MSGSVSASGPIRTLSTRRVYEQPGEHRREASEQTMRSRVVDVAEFEAMVVSGELHDAPSVAAWGLACLRQFLP